MAGLENNAVWFPPLSVSSELFPMSASHDRKVGVYLLHLLIPYLQGVNVGPRLHSGSAEAYPSSKPDGPGSGLRWEQSGRQNPEV